MTNSLLLKILLNSDFPIMLITEKMLLDDGTDEDELKKALLNKPDKGFDFMVVPSPQ